jgi:putative membrane protein
MAEPPDQRGGEDATRRTHLANERTQLAWWRTGLTSVAVGVGIGRVVPELGSGSHAAYAAVGVGYVAYGVLFVLAGTWRQRQVETAVDRAAWRGQDRALVLALTAAGIVLALATAVLIVVDS